MKIPGVLLILVCATSMLPGQQSSADRGTEITIRALEHEWLDAQSSNNNRALDLIFDNGLVYVEYGRLVTKGEYLSRIKATRPQPNQIVMEPITVWTFSNMAVVIGTYREKEIKGGQLAVKRWRYIDTWVFKKNGWVLVAAAAAPVSK